jgi:hypothetical protein
MDTNTNTPYPTVADIVRTMTSIERRLSAAERAILDAATRLDQMADDLGYPVNSTRLTREQLREIAAILREGVQGVRHG